MKVTYLTTICILISFLARSQSFTEKFKELSINDDTINQIKILKEWETAKPKDPELYISYFNYYANKSRKELLAMDSNIKKGEPAIEITDTANGKPVAYLHGTVRYDFKTLQKGFDYIDKGISLHPTRLDMRFGKIYMLGEMGNYSEFTNTIVETIVYGNKINYAWLWKEGKPLEDPKEMFLSSMQDYILTIYDAEDNRLLPLMRQISETVITYFPQDVASLSNIALTYLITNENNKALPYLLKAEAIAPKDIIVLNNLAETYKKKNDKAKARLYYEKIIKYGNKEEVQSAKESIKNL